MFGLKYRCWGGGAKAGWLRDAMLWKLWGSAAVLAVDRPSFGGVGCESLEYLITSK